MPIGKSERSIGDASGGLARQEGSDFFATAEGVKRAANGMLGVRVYERLMDLAHRSQPTTIVEIGTAHGAATIALAIGARAAGAAFHLYTVDPFSGFSSRVMFGGVDDNLRIVNAALSRFGVIDCVTVVVGTATELIARLPSGAIDILLIDADGRIDRDLAALYDRLAPDADIVIDDVDGEVCLARFDNRIYCDQKHRLTRLIVDQLLASGHLRDEQVEEATGFYSKGRGTAAGIEAQAISAYKELVFADIDDIAVAKRQSVFRRGLHRLGTLAGRIRRCFSRSPSADRPAKAQACARSSSQR